jgi:hypothetical protein
MTTRNTKEIVIWSAVTPQAVTSSTDATPIVVTKASHGYSTGDLVEINGHTTNIAANGIFKITVLSSSTFSLQNYVTGANIAGSGAGAGSSGVMVLAPKILFVPDFANIILSFVTSGSFNGTIKLAGSLGKPVVLPSDKQSEDTPNFGATQSASNPYQYVQLINLDTAAGVNGATGITSAGTDLNTQYEVNINAIKYFCPILTAWSAGTITMKALLTDNL